MLGKVSRSLLYFAANTIAIIATIALLTGGQIFANSFITYLVIALVFALINSLLKPVILLLGFLQGSIIMIAFAGCIVNGIFFSVLGWLASGMIDGVNVIVVAVAGGLIMTVLMLIFEWMIERFITDPPYEARELPKIEPPR
ncbi:hypothetical protein MASR2M15_17830 [Anaerolineales bacterium]